MKIRREYSIAGVVIGGVLLLIFGINYLKGLDLLQKRNLYHVVYNDVAGITEATPVYYNGFKVGQVVGRELMPGGRIAVTFQLDEEELKLPDDTEIKIYSADLFSRALQVVLGRSAAMAVSGDTLQGDAELSITDAVSSQIDPLKRKAEGTIANIDSVLTAFQLILNDSARKDIDASFSSIRGTLETFNTTARRIDDLMAAESAAIKATLENIRAVSENLVAYNASVKSILQNMDTVTGQLAGGEIKRMLASLDSSSARLNAVMARISSGEGSLGALLNNDTLYQNLENASREMDMLMEDLRLNPNRYVHLSLFGKKDRLPKLSDSDVDRIKRALQEDKRLP